MPTFNDFWDWLQIRRNVRNLGCGPEWFRIQATDDQHGQVQAQYPNPGQLHEFERAAAQRTWDRYHGSKLAILVPGGGQLDLHRKTRTYLRPPAVNPVPNNWTDIPQPIVVPAWIAAAIAEFLNEHPCANHVIERAD